MSEETIVVTFHTTHDALKCERDLRSGAHPIEIIPTPRPLSSECGFSLLSRGMTAEKLAAVFREKNLPYAAMYRENRSGRDIAYSVIGGKDEPS